MKCAGALSVDRARGVHQNTHMKSQMLEVRQTQEFLRWLNGLKDARAATIIDGRIRRLALGRTGDVKSLGDRVSELRIHYGPGLSGILHEAWREHRPAALRRRKEEAGR